VPAPGGAGIAGGSPSATYGRGMLEAARMRPRGLLFLSNHPWVALAVLAAIIVLVIYLSRRRR
jgi:hypothetical protein